ncbi:MAG: CBS domain-containing protein [Rhodospirillaceae bacterium]|nr:CBS domain-containing protein [Rhodospirillaceae bacterium]
MIRSAMQAKDVMTTWAATVGPDATVQEAAKLMFRRGISALPVVDRQKRVIGIISEGDLVRRVELGTERARSWWLRLVAFPGESDAEDYVKTHASRVRDVMTSPVISVTEATPLEKIALQLEKHRIKRVPVIRAGKLVGIVSRADLVRQIAIAPPAMRPASSTDRSLRKGMLKAMGESGLDAIYLSVSDSDGVLHLWGGLKSDVEKQALRVAAESVSGVRRIEDHTFVLPPLMLGAMGGA